MESEDKSQRAGLEAGKKKTKEAVERHKVEIEYTPAPGTTSHDGQTNSKCLRDEGDWRSW